jgi:23S rRNA (uracil1939-C5)-methyltransferase
MGSYQLVENLTIESISSDEKAVGKKDGKVIFVDNAVPGDVVDVRIYKDKKKYAMGSATHWHQRSSIRQDAFCSHFGVCGGCQWQDIQYQHQLLFKQNIVEDAMVHIGKLTNLPSILPILGSSKTEFYRNKLQYGFSDKIVIHDESFNNKMRFDDGLALGFHVPKYFDKILDIAHCSLQADPSNAIRTFIKAYAIEHQMSFHNLRMHQGLLRDITIRLTSINQLMIIISFYYQDEKNAKLMDALLQAFPGITSLNFVINPKVNDIITDLTIETYFGAGYIEEQLGQLKFKISPPSFFQTNSLQAKVLYDVVKDFAAIETNDLVYDLYTGTGSIALYLSHMAQKVIGVEYVPAAIEDAYQNAAINNISNCEFFAGDMVKTLNDDFLQTHGQPNVVVTDPPRAGMHPKVVEMILKIAPQKIVYVSCNPATQARDLAAMQENYTISKIQPVDMFPHTTHVENVVLLIKK